jgi:hypothetical protein
MAERIQEVVDEGRRMSGKKKELWSSREIIRE